MMPPSSDTATIETATDTADSPTTESTGVPTGLKPVLDVIPEHCYERSTIRGLGIFARDTIIFGLAVWGLLSTNNPLFLIPLWIVSGLAAAGLFVVGHDAAHEALFDSKRLNAVVARLSMLPSLHAVEVWVFGHNRVHHGHTLREGMDFVWHPLTVEQYEELGRFGRLRHKLEWSRFGAGAYYLREVWWNKMVRFPVSKRWARQMNRDKVIIAVYGLGTLIALLALYGFDGIWQWTKVVVIPFLLFCQAIGWVVHVHHIQPDIRWWPRREWNRFRGQVEGTTILWGPPGWDLFFHWIMVHIPHHVDMQIPCYRLPDAANAIAEAFPNEVDERPIRVSDYVNATRICKLHDFETGTWLPYPSKA